MTLLQVIKHYKSMVRADGRESADQWLVSVGVHPAVRKAIRSSVKEPSHE